MKKVIEENLVFCMLAALISSVFVLGFISPKPKEEHNLTHSQNYDIPL